MFRCAIVVLPDAFLASVGAMVDSWSLVFERFRHLVVEPDDLPPEMSLQVLSLDGHPVTVGGGISYRVDKAIDATDRFDFVWLPSFRVGEIDAMRQRMASSRQLVRWVEAQAKVGTMIGASGAATLLLVAARLLEGSRVPVSKVFLPTVRSLYPRCLADDKLANAHYGNLFLSKGIARDFSVISQAIGQMISSSSGRWLAEVTAEVDAGSGHLSGDPLVASAQLWIEQLYATDMTVEDLAQRLSTSQPTLARRFKTALGITPKAYAQEMRMRAAQAMLFGSTRTIEEIAGLVGYSDARLFRRAFRKYTGGTAGSWRQGQATNEENCPHIEE